MLLTSSGAEVCSRSGNADSAVLASGAGRLKAMPASVELMVISGTPARITILAW